MAAAANAVNQIPGLDISIDIGLCQKMLAEIRSKFGLDLQKESSLRDYEVLIPLTDKVFWYLTKEGIIYLLKQVSTHYADSSFINYVPLLGQVLAAVSGYSLIMLLGEIYVDDCYELASKVLQIKSKQKWLKPQRPAVALFMKGCI